MRGAPPSSATRPAHDPQPEPAAGPRGPGARTSFLAVALLALGLRLVAQQELSRSVFGQLLLGDAAFYDGWARALAAGGDLDEPVLFQSALYPWLLGLVYRLAGPRPELVLAAQACLGALGAGLLALVTRRLFGAWAGLAAGLLAALYAPWIWYDGLLHKTSLGLFLACVLLWIAESARTSAGARAPARAALAGGVLGLLALLRPNALVLAPVWLAWLASRARGTGARWATAAAFLLLLALPPGLLGLRNLAHGGSFQPLAGNAGVNFYQGNGLQADGLYRPLVVGRGDPAYESADSVALAERALGRPLSPGAVQRYWFARGLSEIREAPVRWLALVLRKARLALGAREAMDSVALEAHARHSRVLALAARVAGFGTLLPLAALGLWCAWPRRRELWWLFLAPALLYASIVAFLVVGRLRAGLVPFLLPLAGAGLVELARALAAARSRRIGRDLALVTGAALLAWLSPKVHGDPVATSHANVAAELLQRGRPEDAAREAREALERQPDAPEARFNLGMALAELGDAAGAERELTRAAALEPALALRVHERLGVLAGAAGDFARAEACFRRALALDPEAPVLHYDLGLALRRLGRLEEAEAAYDQALRLRPDYAEAHHNRGFLLELRGRPREAADAFARAIACDPGFVPSHLRLAWLLATSADPELRDPAEALRLARAARELGAPACEVADALACALAAGGRFQEALALTRSLLEDARARGDQRVLQAFEERAARYAAGQGLAPGTQGPLACGP